MTLDKFPRNDMSDFVDLMILLVKKIGVIHKRGYALCDIKFDNILIVRRHGCFQPYVVDYGSSHPLDLHTGTSDIHYSAVKNYPSLHNFMENFPQVSLNIFSYFADQYNLCILLECIID